MQSAADIDAVRHMRAWLLLVGSLALHVADEAATDFLEFYNPLLLSIRSEVPWFPMPTFTFGIWIGGLVLLVLGLAALAPVVRQGAAVIWPASWALGIIMFMNGVAHLAGSLYFQRWLPGSTSAPVLLATSVFLMRVTWQRYRSNRAGIRDAV